MGQGLKENDKDSHHMPLEVDKETEFESWLNKTSRTTLEQQVAFAKSIHDQVHEIDPTPVEKIVSDLRQSPLDGDLAIWKGIQVNWLRSVFFKEPLVEKWKEMGCQMWFIRKVGIIEMMRRCDIKSGTYIEHIPTMFAADPAIIVQPATTFLSYTGGYTMTAFASLLELLDGNEYVWIDLFCVDQFAWTGRGKSQELNAFRETLTSNLNKKIRGIGKTSLMLEKWDQVMEALGKIWVLWEIFNTVESKSQFNILLPPSETRDLLETINVSIERIRSSFSKINAMEAQAQNPADRSLILDLIKDKGIHDVNCRIVEVMKVWIVNAALMFMRDNPAGLGSAFINNLSILLSDFGDVSKSVHILKDLWQKVEANNTTADEVCTVVSNLIEALRVGNRLDEAEQLSLKALSTTQTDDNGKIIKGRLASVLRDQGRSSEAEELYKELLEYCNKSTVPSQVFRLATYANYSLTLLQQARFSEAEPLAYEAVNISERLHGNRHATTLELSNILALIISEKGSPLEAGQLYESTLLAMREQLGVAHPKTLNCMNNFVVNLKDQQKLDESVKYGEEAVNLCRTHLGERHATTLEALSNLSISYRNRGDLNAAEQCARLSLCDSQDKFYLEETQLRCCALGSILAQKGDVCEAISYYDVALNSSRQCFVSTGNVKAYSVALGYRASLYLALGLLDDAEQLTEERIAIFTRNEYHPSCLASMKTLSEIYLKKAMPERARDVAQTGLEIAQSQYGRDSKISAELGLALAHTEFALDNLAVAERLYRNALDWLNNTTDTGISNLQMARLGVRKSLAIVVDKQQRHREAQELLEVARQEAILQLGSNHLLSMEFCYHLAASLFSQRKYGEAHPIYINLIPRIILAMGSSNSWSLQCRLKCAANLKMLGQTRNAEKMAQTTLIEAETAVGRYHPLVSDLLGELGSILFLQHRYLESILVFWKQASRRVWTLGWRDFVTATCKVLGLKESNPS